MKLCRFELLAEPGSVKSGIVHSGRVYETDGANAIAVHEAAAVRPLPPVQPPSVRVYRTTDISREVSLGPEMEAAPFFYLNAANVVGASTLIPFSDEVAQLECEPYLAAVIAAPGRNIPVADADSYILGLTIMSVLVARDIERRDHPAGMAFGRAYDLGLGVGPVITTLEELDDVLIDEDHGRRHDLEVVVRINGVEKQRGNAQDMPYTFGQLISFASETSTLRMGDIIAMGPVASGANFDLSSGDDVQVAIGQLGALSLKIS